MYNVPIKHKKCATCRWWSGGRKLVFVGAKFATDVVVARYVLNEHECNLLAVKYHLGVVTEEERQRELQRERAVLEESPLFLFRRQRAVVRYWGRMRQRLMKNLRKKGGEKWSTRNL